MKKSAFGIVLTLLVLSMSSLVFNAHPVRANETIYIRSDGSVDGTDKIQRNGNIYTFTSNVNGSIFVQRSNIAIDGAGFTLQGSGSGKGIDLPERDYVTIRNMNVKKFTWGIYISSYAYHNNISGNTLIDNYHAIYLTDSANYNIIAGNTITDNLRGIELHEASNYNTISGNNIRNNEYGIELFGSSTHNSIVENTIENNIDDGIHLSQSSDNYIYHNSFFNNSDQVYSYNSDNSWDNGYPSGGNYWSDYTGNDTYSGPNQNITGSDGIGDTPYIINTNNRDNYPKVQVPTDGGGFNWLILVIIIVVAGGAVSAIVLILRMRKRPMPQLPPPPPPRSP